MAHTTQKHPFWDQSRQAWVNAADLRTGDQLKTATHGVTVTVITKTIVAGAADMWDLTIPGLHDFYITTGTNTASILVHNCPAASNEDYETAAQQPDRAGPTKAGRGLQKHSDRDGSAFNGMSTGNVTTRNEQGIQMVRRILGDPARTVEEGINVTNITGSSTTPPLRAPA